MHAVYCTEAAIKEAKEVLAEGRTDLVSMVEKMHGVRYLSTMVIEQLDPDFRSFFRATTPADLRKASAMSKPKPKKLKTLRTKKKKR